MGTKATPSQVRRRDADWVATCSLTGLQNRLPLSWPTSPDTLPCPKVRFRSQYIYQGWEDLRQADTWQHLTLFELLLRLVDFSTLRPVLAQLRDWKNDRGWIPFDPVSIFLLILWRLSNRWNRSQTIRNIHKPLYADMVALMGFKGAYPTEGGLRYIETCLGLNSEDPAQVIEVQSEEGPAYQIAFQRLNELIIQSVELLRQAGILRDTVWQQALICPDGMLHAAASRMRCSTTNADCYQPAPRPCAAQQKGRDGCNCDQDACQQICRFAAPRDPQARFVWYTGSNRPGDNPNRPLDPHKRKKKRGKGVFGYRSLAFQLCDPHHRFNITLLNDFLPANLPEAPFATAQLLQLPEYYPDLKVDVVAGDAAFGTEPFLHAIYHPLHARRVVDLRTHDTDRNKTLWPIRGYDDKGRPVCPFGYALTANGFDTRRRRHKWICAKACLKQVKPRVRLPDTSYPPPECPFQDHIHPLGKVINVAAKFKDGSIRLVRDLPFGTPAWKQYYCRARNAAEARNSVHETLGLKRMPLYGLPRGKSLSFLADVWGNLSTLARLIREATAATGG